MDQCVIQVKDYGPHMPTHTAELLPDTTSKDEMILSTFLTGVQALKVALSDAEPMHISMQRTRELQICDITQDT